MSLCQASVDNILVRYEKRRRKSNVFECSKMDYCMSKEEAPLAGVSAEAPNLPLYLLTPTKAGYSCVRHPRLQTGGRLIIVVVCWSCRLSCVLCRVSSVFTSLLSVHRVPSAWHSSIIRIVNFLSFFLLSSKLYQRRANMYSGNVGKTEGRCFLRSIIRMLINARPRDAIIIYYCINFHAASPMDDAC